VSSPLPVKVRATSWYLAGGRGADAKSEITHLDGGDQAQHRNATPNPRPAVTCRCGLPFDEALVLAVVATNGPDKRVRRDGSRPICSTATAAFVEVHRRRGSTIAVIAGSMGPPGWRDWSDQHPPIVNDAGPVQTRPPVRLSAQRVEPVRTAPRPSNGSGAGGRENRPPPALMAPRAVAGA